MSLLSDHAAVSVEKRGARDIATTLHSHIAPLQGRQAVHFARESDRKQRVRLVTVAREHSIGWRGPWILCIENGGGGWWPSCRERRLRSVVMQPHPPSNIAMNSDDGSGHWLLDREQLMISKEIGRGLFIDTCFPARSLIKCTTPCHSWFQPHHFETSLHC